MLACCSASEWLSVLGVYMLRVRVGMSYTSVRFNGFYSRVQWFYGAEKNTKNKTHISKHNTTHYEHN